MKGASYHWTTAEIKPVYMRSHSYEWDSFESYAEETTLVLKAGGKVNYWFGKNSCLLDLANSFSNQFLVL